MPNFELSDVREADERDTDYIRFSFLKSFRNNHTTACISNEDYYANYRPLILDLIQRPEVVTLIACSPRNPDFIQAWAMVEPGPVQVLYYGFTKKTFRGTGLFTGLIQEAGLDLTRAFLYPFKSIDADFLRRRKEGEITAVYNPFVVLKPELKARCDLVGGLGWE